MPVPSGWRPHSTAVGLIVFAVLALPILAVAIEFGFSDGFTLSKAVAAPLYLIVVGFASWLLSYGLSRGSIVLVTVASLVVILILVVYAAAISLLVGGLKIRVF